MNDFFQISRDLTRFSGVEIHKVDENNKESFLPKMGLNWMRIKVPV